METALAKDWEASADQLVPVREDELDLDDDDASSVVSVAVSVQSQVPDNGISLDDDVTDKKPHKIQRKPWTFKGSQI
jgi:hypothetical protein